MRIYTIIVTYNAMPWIDRCLCSLQTSTVPVIPVIIDNGSTDGTRDHVPSLYPDAVWLPQEGNLGFGQGNNVGFRYALARGADYLLLLNQDAYLAPDAITKMLKQCDGKSLLSPVHLNGDGTRLDDGFKRYGLMPSDNDLLDDLLTHGTLTRYEVPFVNGACWFLPVRVARKIGGFNPLFFHYGEDGNYFHRLRYHGFKAYVVPTAAVRHDRVKVGNAAAFRRGEIQREFLLEACNINHSLLLRCRYYLRILAIYRTRPWDCLKAFLEVMGQCLQVRRSRSIDRRMGQNWLL